jgi:hypothetical protein
MNTSYIISIINTILVAEGWYHFLGKKPNVYIIMTSGVCCTCIPLCMEMLLDTFCKFLSYSLCNCWTEGLSSRHWHSLLERCIWYYISCLLRISYVLFIESICFITSTTNVLQFRLSSSTLVCSLVLHLAGAGGYSFHCYSHFGRS